MPVAYVAACRAQKSCKWCFRGCFGKKGSSNSLGIVGAAVKWTNTGSFATNAHTLQYGQILFVILLTKYLEGIVLDIKRKAIYHTKQYHFPEHRLHYPNNFCHESCVFSMVFNQDKFCSQKCNLYSPQTPHTFLWHSNIGKHRRSYCSILQDMLKKYVVQLNSLRWLFSKVFNMLFIRVISTNSSLHFCSTLK